MSSPSSGLRKNRSTCVVAGSSRRSRAVPSVILSFRGCLAMSSPRLDTARHCRKDLRHTRCSTQPARLLRRSCVVRAPAVATSAGSAEAARSAIAVRPAETAGRSRRPARAHAAGGTRRLPRWLIRLASWAASSTWKPSNIRPSARRQVGLHEAQRAVDRDVGVAHSATAALTSLDLLGEPVDEMRLVAASGSRASGDRRRRRAARCRAVRSSAWRRRPTRRRARRRCDRCCRAAPGSRGRAARTAPGFRRLASTLRHRVRSPSAPCANARSWAGPSAARTASLSANG